MNETICQKFEGEQREVICEALEIRNKREKPYN